MNKYFYMLMSAGFVLLMNACQTKQPETKEEPMKNPLLEEFSTAFGVPPFDLIQPEHFKPAFEEGMKLHREEIAEIIQNAAKPDFENTIEAYENAGKLLSRTSTIFYNLNSAHTNDELMAIAQEIAPVTSAHYDEILMNAALFAKISDINNQKESMNLTGEQAKLLENVYKNFVRSGANLSDEDKQRMKEINKELSRHTVQFGQNILAETNQFELIVNNKEDLKGLPQGLIDAAADEAKSKDLENKWVFTLHNPSVMPFLQYAENRDLREKIWNAYQMRGNNNNEYDNKEILTNIANLRSEKASLLGYESHAHYVLEESMAKTPDKIFELLNKLWPNAKKLADKELKEMQALIKTSGEDFELKPWDWSYYAEKIRIRDYQLDEEQLKPYFSLERVKEGIFETTRKLYGLTYKKLDNVPVYHEEVTVYEVFDENGEHLSLLYMDFHPRESKRGGAWMTSYRKQSMKESKRVAPVISIVCNFSKPTANTPALLTFDETQTFFHEFGHALHGMLSQVHYESLSGTSVPRDFVELPSQIMENWAAEPEVLKTYALHYKTGEPIPDELIQKMSNASLFNQGFATVEYLAASFLDMSYHVLKAPLDKNVEEFESKAMNDIGLIDEIIPRYRSSYFNHIFAGGYSAGYYSYIWSELLDADAFEAFKTTGLFDATTALSFRQNILEKGGTQDPALLYRQFRGAEPRIEPLLKKRGLN
jgi:peptidyl-dipeptidase Dcp